MNNTKKLKRIQTKINKFKKVRVKIKHYICICI